MTLRPVGRKIIDILVNGNQQDSFTQTSESANYDVNINDKQKTIETPVAYGGNFNIKSDEQVNIINSTGATDGTVGSPSPSKIHATAFRLQIINSDVPETDLYILAQDSNYNNYIDGSIAYIGGFPYDSGWISFDGDMLYRLRFWNKNSQAGGIDYRLSYRFKVSSGFSIGSVTQS